MATFSRVELAWGLDRLPLSSPYRLSFATLTEISTVWVRAEDDLGRTGWGEGVPLFGYSDETEGVVFEDVGRLVREIRGRDEQAARKVIVEAGDMAPTAVSAVATALDMLTFPVRAPLRFPLVAPLSTDVPPDALAESFEGALGAGFRHLKVKTGKDVEQSLSARAWLERRCLETGTTVRYDANQAYGEAEALEFCNALPAGESVIWLEQPLHRDDWEGMARLCAKTDFPLMLDESIYTEEDIRRASAMGCAAIKLKLFKHPGMHECVRLARVAGDLGLKVILGNGVASDIGNFAEAQVIGRCADILEPGAECNGYHKLLRNVLYDGLAVVDGDLVLSDGTPSASPRLSNL
jgi:L-alanine-DL-glutamate epimerase-like enolase superfamily enzyme